jgi:predicted RNA-binding protein Jag
MSNTVTVEGNSIADALKSAAEQMGANPSDLKWTLDKDHFPAMTVKLHVQPLDEATIEARKAAAEMTVGAVKWVEGALEKFGSTDASVSARVNGKTLTVNIDTEEDSGLLIGKEGKNLEALQTLFRKSVGKDFEGYELVLDVGGYRSRERGGREDRPRRDRDDRGRGRDRDDRGGRSRDGGGRDGGGRDGGGRDGGGRDGGGRGRDGGGGRGRDRGERGSKDPARDEELKVRIKVAAEKARDEGEPVQFTDLNSYERYLAHTVVKEIEGVDSRSVGKGADKAVEVFPS